MTDTVSFQFGDCHMALFLPRLCELSIKNLRKVFTMMLSEPWNNQEAMDCLQWFLPDAVTESKAAWDQASIDYQHGWKLIEKPLRRRTLKERQADAAIRANNEALLRAAKKSKALYERWVKIQQLWEDTKHQLNDE